MRITAFATGFPLLIISLFIFLLSGTGLLADIAYATILVSMVLLAFDSWINRYLFKRVPSHGHQSDRLQG